MHKDIKFVIQTCQEDELPYLDTQVTIKNNKFITSIFRKPTSTGVLMNFNSCVPQSWKRNLVKNLNHRIKNLVTEDLQNNEWQKVKELLMKNSFPAKFIDEQIQKKDTFETELIENKDDKKQFITMPYVKKMSEKFSRNIKTVFEGIGVKVRIAYRSENFR